MKKFENLDEFMAHQKMLRILKRLEADDQARERSAREIAEKKNEERVEMYVAIFTFMFKLIKVLIVLALIAALLYWWGWIATVIVSVIVFYIYISVVCANDSARAEEAFRLSSTPEERIEKQLIDANRTMKKLALLSIILFWDRRKQLG